MRDHLEQMPGVTPVVISFTDHVERLTAYQDHLDIDFQILANPDRSLYRAIGAGKGSLRRVWSPGTIALYVRLVRTGRRLRPPRDDTRQLGADLLIDSDGVLRRVWLPAGPDLRPSIAELVDAVHDLPRS